MTRVYRQQVPHIDPGRRRRQKPVGAVLAGLVAFGLAYGAIEGAQAGDAEILAVKVTQTGGAYRFDVTVRHGDEGWDHYADGWEVVTPDGKSLGLRTLYHPHVDEQPFTRSLSNVVIPADLEEVIVRVRDSVHGWSDDVYRAQLK